MQIELEKKYNLSKEDYKIIRDKCEFIKEVTLKDYYLDKDYILVKNDYYLRLRNGKYELKICSQNPDTKMVSSEEYENEDEINKKLEKFNIVIDDAIGVLFVDTKREKYTYEYKGYNLNIDVEEYQYGTRYEIEIVYNEEDESKDRQTIENELNLIIEGFIKKLGLNAQSDSNSSKVQICAMHQNIGFYEITTKNYI
ncbi:MAG: CYTH domain-containing protein [Candidatus Gracilibacteria bacterium]